MLKHTVNALKAKHVVTAMLQTAIYTLATFLRAEKWKDPHFSFYLQYMCSIFTIFGRNLP